MNRRITRRSLLAAAVAGALRAEPGLERLGIMCQLEAEERPARKVLEAARQAGFQRAQITFPWDRAGPEFLKGLPRWIEAAGVQAVALGAYVNCAAPENVIMSTRAADFDRAIGYAAETGAQRLVAWTGGFGGGLMVPDARNHTAEASEAVVRFLDGKIHRIESHGLIVALESYITLVGPDAASLRRLLDRLPGCITAVLDPPNLIPIERYAARDVELQAMFQILGGRIGIVHMKDFRLAADGRSYDLPGPLGGVLNYEVFTELVRRLPPEIPAIAEHVGPDRFSVTRRELGPYFAR